MVAAQIESWQQMLWQFHPIGHLGRKGAPQRWMEPKNPFIDRQRISIDFPDDQTEQEYTLYLSSRRITGDSGSIAWRKPSIETAGGATIPLRDVRGAVQRIQQQRAEFFANLSQYLVAAASIQSGASVSEVIDDYQLNAAVFNRWLDYLGLSRGDVVVVQGHFSEPLANVAGYSFVSGWGSSSTPSVVANRSGQDVRIPGLAAAQAVLVHPSPELFAAVGWQSPVAGEVEVNAKILDAHRECGNGVEWVLQHRSGDRLVELGRGEFGAGGQGSVAELRIDLSKGDLISLLVGPRQRNHACDLTRVDLTIEQLAGKQHQWSLSREIPGRIDDGNPLSDSIGNQSVWHLYSGRVDQIGSSSGPNIPADSLLARWQESTSRSEQLPLETQIQRLASGPRPTADTPDAALYRQLQQIVDYGMLDAQQIPADHRFGRNQDAADGSSADLFTPVGGSVAFQIPKAFAAGGRFVVDVGWDRAEQPGACQVRASLSRPEADRPMDPARPVLIGGSPADRKLLEAGIEQFRALFPAALCYTKIVPVDEVVTLQLYYREDDHLKRLMCSESDAVHLDRLWDQLLFVAREPLAAEVALEQSHQFATQDRPDLAVEFDELKAIYRQRSAAFRQRLVDTESIHVEALLGIAADAWRRDLTADESESLRGEYSQLRQQEMPHEDAIRLMVARILVAPAFLYRLEAPGQELEPVDVTDHELATRLSYFLWSSMPDLELRRAAASGALSDRANLIKQTRRMLSNAKIRRMAIHFACQWLHLRDFDSTVQKNERMYPEFASIKQDIYEEAVLFFEDMFRNDRSILDFVTGDHSFVNDRLAAHYGIDGIQGADWRRIGGMRQHGRGGVLGLAAVLASQSGASRTSPILRGNWVYETLLGQQLPKPPADVPQLPDAVPQGKTARQLIELHSTVPQCAKCHQRIDPYGFALEQFDAIGRLRPAQVDTSTTLASGQTIDGLEGLRQYLATDRRDVVLRQFCKKLLGYALGREVQLSDWPLLDEMQQKLMEQDYRFSLAVETIVTSRQFRQIRGRSAEGHTVE